MAAPIKVSEEELVTAAIGLIRAGGPEALNARRLAGALHCSTQPIFRCFATMEALRTAVLERAHSLYRSRLEAAAARSSDPPYKAKGMAYVAFAMEEPNLFRLLFMRARDGAEPGPEEADWQPDIALSAAGTGLRGHAAERFHLEMWAFVHGIAVMHATGYLRLDEAAISEMLTDVYQALKHKWGEIH